MTNYFLVFGPLQKLLCLKVIFLGSKNQEIFRLLFSRSEECISATLEFSHLFITYLASSSHQFHTSHLFFTFILHLFSRHHIYSSHLLFTFIFHIYPSQKEPVSQYLWSIQTYLKYYGSLTEEA